MIKCFVLKSSFKLCLGRESADWLSNFDFISNKKPAQLKHMEMLSREDIIRTYLGSPNSAIGQEMGSCIWTFSHQKYTICT